MAKFVLICGPQAVGKMTVGQELAKLTGLKFMHNHETIDLPLKFFEFKSEQRERLTDLFRFSIFEEVAKSDLKGMIKQKYGNGKWIGITLHYCPKCFSIYHLVPFLFVLGILFSVIMAFVNVPIFVYLLTSAYLLFNILNIILITIKNGFSISYLLLPFIFFVLHCAYGIGTVVGIVKGFFMKRKRK